MKKIEAKEINVRNILVATYNADLFNVSDANAYGDIYETLENADQGLVDMYTAEDEEFEGLADLLDYSSDNLPSAIYVVNGNELTFAMDESLPTVKSYKVVDTRNGEQKGRVIEEGISLMEARQTLLTKAATICDKAAQNEVILNEADAQALIEYCFDDPEQVGKVEEIIKDGAWGVYTNINEGCELLYKAGSDVFWYDNHKYEIVAE